jgi:oligopeptide/dipeptide ABC transporter ATP-binding protein
VKKLVVNGSTADSDALSVSRLRVGYANSPDVVADISLTVPRGSRLGITGESGCGKSTLGLALLRLLPVPGVIRSGTISIAGHAVTGMPERGLRAIRGRDASLIYQDASASLDPVKRIGAQLAEAISAHAKPRGDYSSQVAAALESVNIGAERARSYPHELSGGMRQRVAIAMALMNRPALVIADEPTTALDVTTQASVLGLLDRRVDETGCALVLITHDLNVIADRCQVTAVMYAGKFVEIGPTAQVLGRPQHPYTRALVSCSRALATGTRRRLPTLSGTASYDAGPGCVYAGRCDIRRDDPACTQTPPLLRSTPYDGSAASTHQAACHHLGELVE